MSVEAYLDKYLGAYCATCERRGCEHCPVPEQRLDLGDGKSIAWRDVMTYWQYIR